MADNLEQPNTESNEINYESENDLLDAIRNEAEKQRNALESNTEEPTEESASEVVEEEVKTQEDNLETSNEDNDNTTLDEDEAVAKWLAEGKFDRAIPLKNKDLTIEITSVQEAQKLMEKGLDYTRKTQELAEIRKYADYVKQHNIAMEDLQTLADLKNGSKEALASLAKRSNIDIYDVDATANYQPSQQVTYREMSEAEMVANEIARDEVLYNDVSKALTYVPSNVGERIVTDAKLLSAFSQDVKSGIAKDVIPQALKNFAVYGGDFIEHYVSVANSMFPVDGYAQAPEQVGNKIPNPSVQSKTKASISSNGGKNTATVDVWNANLSQDDMMEELRRQASILKG